MTAITLTATDKVNIDISRNEVIITDVDVDEVIHEIGTEELLYSMDYSDIVAFVNEQEEMKKEDDYDRRVDK